MTMSGISARLGGMIALVARIWPGRRRQRIALAEMDRAQLRDLGLEPDEVRREAARPFWQGSARW